MHELNCSQHRCATLDLAAGEAFHIKPQTSLITDHESRITKPSPILLHPSVAEANQSGTGGRATSIL